MKEFLYSVIIVLLLPVIIATASLGSYVVLGFAVLALLLLMVLLYQSYSGYNLDDRYFENNGFELKIKISEEYINAYKNKNN